MLSHLSKSGIEIQEITEKSREAHAACCFYCILGVTAKLPPKYDLQFMSFLSACNSILHSFLCCLHGDRQQPLGSCHSPGQSHLLSTGYPPKLAMPFSTKHCFYFQLSLVALLCDNFGFLDKANLSIFATSFNSVSSEELKLSKLLQNQQPI